jgi:hypothetical protein
MEKEDIIAGRVVGSGMYTKIEWQVVKSIPQSS